MSRTDPTYCLNPLEFLYESLLFFDLFLCAIVQFLVMLFAFYFVFFVIRELVEWVLCYVLIRASIQLQQLPGYAIITVFDVLQDCW